MTRIGVDRNGVEVCVGAKLRCCCGCESVIEVVRFEDDGVFEIYWPAMGRGLARSNVEVAPSETPLRPVPD